jgi:hypothetical protein
MPTRLSFWIVSVTENNIPSSVDPPPSHFPSSGETETGAGIGVVTSTGFEMQAESKNIGTIKTNKI